jgi:hypothetical protein
MSDTSARSATPELPVSADAPETIGHPTWGQYLLL